MTDWQPLNTVLGFVQEYMPPPPKVDNTPEQRESDALLQKAVKTNIPQATLVGWICLAFAIGFLIMSREVWYLYTPFFLASFILSIVIMAQGRIGQGIALLLAIPFLTIILLSYFVTMPEEANFMRENEAQRAKMDKEHAEQMKQLEASMREARSIKKQDSSAP